MKYYATRDLSKCTKDCLCLYVCPTGATDTENGQVDFEKCIGCGACVNACPSRALTLLPWVYPEEQIHDELIIKHLMKVFKNKEEQVKRLKGMLPEGKNQERLIKALDISAEVQAEDLIREAGYMLPDGKKASEFYEDLLKTYPDLESDLVNLGKLARIESLKGTSKEVFKEPTSIKHRCTICGYIYDDSKEEVPFDKLPSDWACPICGAPKSAFELVTE